MSLLLLFTAQTVEAEVWNYDGDPDFDYDGTVDWTYDGDDLDQ